jgi:hypothetical protein
VPKYDYKVFQQMDEALEGALQPTPTGARVDLRLYFREDEKGQKASVVLLGGSGKPVTDDLFMDSPQGLNFWLSRLQYECFKRARRLRQRPLDSRPS